MSNASFYSKCPGKWKRKWEIYISASHTSHYYQAVESISIQVLNLQTNSCSRYFGAPPPHQLGKLGLQLTRVVRCQIFYTKTSIKTNFYSPMKTLGCGHFPWRRYLWTFCRCAVCTLQWPLSTALQPQCLNQCLSASVSQPVLTEIDKFTQHQRSVQVFFSNLELSRSSAIGKKHISCFGSTRSVIVLHWIKRLHGKSRRPPKRAKFLFAELSFPQFGQYKPIEKTAWEITAVQFCSIFRWKICWNCSFIFSLFTIQIYIIRCAKWSSPC